jgi:REP element-mobilizing transposase RayT
VTRYARLHLPGLVHHVIARFVNREFRLARDEARAEYLHRLGRHLGDCDWRLLGYALMSSHVHLVLRAGNDPSARLVAPLHTGFALWLNRTQGRMGPVFASRHTTIAFADEGAAGLLAYVHNNPVRAGVVERAIDSSWTSHRAYLGRASAPPWLGVAEGLALAGVPGAPDLFDALVRERAGRAREPAWSDEPRREQRAARLAAGAPVRVSWPLVESEGRQFAVQRAGGLRPRWPGRPEDVVERVARHLHVRATEVVGPLRSESLTEARRTAMLAWTMGLGRLQMEMACCLGISAAAASQLLHARPDAIASCRQAAQLITEMCWEAEAQGEKAE